MIKLLIFLTFIVNIPSFAQVSGTYLGQSSREILNLIRLNRKAEINTGKDGDIIVMNLGNSEYLFLIKDELCYLQRISSPIKPEIDELFNYISNTETLISLPENRYFSVAGQYFLALDKSDGRYTITYSLGSISFLKKWVNQEYRRSTKY